MLKGYSPKGADRVLPQFKDDKQPEKWVGNTAFMTGIAINKEELKKKKFTDARIIRRLNETRV